MSRRSPCDAPYFWSLTLIDCQRPFDPSIHYFSKNVLFGGHGRRTHQPLFLSETALPIRLHAESSQLVCPCGLAIGLLLETHAKAIALTTRDAWHTSC